MMTAASPSQKSVETIIQAVIQPLDIPGYEYIGIGIGIWVPSFHA